MTSRAAVRWRRVYERPEGEDGRRVLVDRIWPRGVRNDGSLVDEWCKDVAPSTELRTWYAHDRERFEEFARRYRDELRTDAQAEALAHLRDLAAQGPLTLLTATRDASRSQAAVLADLLGR